VPTITYKNAMLVVNNVDLSGNIGSLSLSYEAESLDETAMGLTSRKFKGGLKVHRVEALFFQKFSCVDATLFGLVGCQTSVEIRACNACSGADNPVFEATYMLRSYPLLGGKVGDLLSASVVFEPAGDLRHCAVVS